jgi:hypothetical protein
VIFSRTFSTFNVVTMANHHHRPKQILTKEQLKVVRSRMRCKFGKLCPRILTGCAYGHTEEQRKDAMEGLEPVTDYRSERKFNLFFDGHKFTPDNREEVWRGEVKSGEMKPCRNGSICEWIFNGCRYFHSHEEIEDALCRREIRAERLKKAKEDEKGELYKFEEQQDEERIRRQIDEERRKKEKEKNDAKNEADAKKDIEFYNARMRRSITGFILLKESTESTLPTVIRSVIWAYCTPIFTPTLPKTVRVANPYFAHDNACKCCKLQTPAWVHGSNFECDACRGLIKENGFSYLSILLIHKENKSCFRVHDNSCVERMGLTFHDSSKCKIGFNPELAQHDATKCGLCALPNTECQKTGRLELLEGCLQCISTHYLQLEFVGKDYEVINIRNEKETRLCPMRCYYTAVKPEKVGDFKSSWTPVETVTLNMLGKEKDEIPEKNGDIYHICDRPTYDTLRQHISMIPRGGRCCMVCLSLRKFSCDGFNLCDKVGCHWRVGIRVRQLVVLDDNPPAVEDEEDDDPRGGMGGSGMYG